MKKSFTTVLLFLAAFFATSVHAQHIDPTWQIDWPTGYPIAPSPTGNQSITQLPGSTLSLNSLNYDVTVGGNGYTTIQAAVNEAVTIGGSVTILATYSGTDTWTNVGNVHITDLRPFNPSQSTSYSNQVLPHTTLKAADYGALCNGTNDDTAAIQDSVDALTAMVGILQTPPQLMIPASVELPQGRCVINAPIVLMNYGSIEGHKNGSWITPGNSWSAPAGSALINIESSYDHSEFLNQGDTTINRFVKDINFSYNSNGHQIEAIKVWSQTGSSSAYPYVEGSDPNTQQIPGVVIEGNSVYAMDTGIEVDDCGECTIRENQINAVRVGIVDGGNNYALVTQTNTVQQGSKSFTPDTTDPSMGLYSYGQARWTCIGGTGQTCSGGTITNSYAAGAVYVSPQGFGVYASVIESAWDYGAYIVNALGFDVDSGTCICDSTVAVYAGNIVGLKLVNSSFSTSSASGPAIDIAAPVSNPGTGEAVDNGWWIVNNTISTDNNTTGTAIGIKLEAGVYPLVDLSLKDNQLYGFATAIQLNAPLTQSRIVGNYGDKNVTSFITLNASGSSSFAQTVIHDNTSRDSINILTDTAGGGYILGYNSSATQTTGNQLATGSGCSITAGAIGGVCVASMTLANSYHSGDTAYTVSGCQVTGTSTNAVAGVVANVTNVGFTVVETAMTASAVSGGTIECQVFHP